MVHTGAPGCINPVKIRFWRFTQYLLASHILSAVTATRLLSASLNSVLSRFHVSLWWKMTVGWWHRTYTTLQTPFFLLGTTYPSLFSPRKDENVLTTTDCLSDTHQSCAHSINQRTSCDRGLEWEGFLTAQPHCFLYSVSPMSCQFWVWSSWLNHLKVQNKVSLFLGKLAGLGFR